jgi:hypothetical protein
MKHRKSALYATSISLISGWQKIKNGGIKRTENLTVLENSFLRT